MTARESRSADGRRGAVVPHISGGFLSPRPSCHSILVSAFGLLSCFFLYFLKWERFHSIFLKNNIRMKLSMKNHGQFNTMEFPCCRILHCKSRIPLPTVTAVLPILLSQRSHPEDDISRFSFLPFTLRRSTSIRWIFCCLLDYFAFRRGGICWMSNLLRSWTCVACSLSREAKHVHALSWANSQGLLWSSSDGDSPSNLWS